MKQVDLERAIARATGESVSAIRRFGFSLEEPASSFEREANEAEPQFIDWDVLDAQRYEENARRPWHAPTAA